MDGRDGYTNAELAAMWPRTPNRSCPCGHRGVCVWSVGPIRLLCVPCHEHYVGPLPAGREVTV